MRVLVSSCIMGCNCKYNGGNNLNENVIECFDEMDQSNIDEPSCLLCGNVAEVRPYEYKQVYGKAYRS